MNSQQAKEILLLYRPGVDDANEPEVSEAMRLAAVDPDLRQWYEEQSAWQQAMRSRFREIAIPEGLREQILSERKAFTFRLPQLLKWVPVAACVLILAGILTYNNYRPSIDRVASFRGRMSRIASREYPRMDLETSDLNKIHQYLLQNHVPDYELPANLQKATGTGCAILDWRDPAGQHRKVAMICFKSGRAPNPDAIAAATGGADLFLFVVEAAAVPNAPSASAPTTGDSSGLATASWQSNGRTYLLAGAGSAEFLKNYY